MDAKVIERSVLPNGQRVVLAEVTCQCGNLAGEHWFNSGEPMECLCAKCASASLAENYGNVAKGHKSPRGMRFVAGECAPGVSSGKERKHMSMGDAENANGFWDNMVREYEG